MSAIQGCGMASAPRGRPAPATSNVDRDADPPPRRLPLLHSVLLHPAWRISMSCSTMRSTTASLRMSITAFSSSTPSSFRSAISRRMSSGGGPQHDFVHQPPPQKASLGPRRTSNFLPAVAPQLCRHKSACHDVACLAMHRGAAPPSLADLSPRLATARAHRVRTRFRPVRDAWPAGRKHRPARGHWRVIAAHVHHLQPIPPADATACETSNSDARNATAREHPDNSGLGAPRPLRPLHPAVISCVA